MKHLSSFFVFCLLLILLSVASFAHLDGGEDVTRGGYILDFGHSPEKIASGASATLAFNLLNVTTEKIVAFESAWVRISKDETILFAGTLHPENEHVVFDYSFVSAGEYEITVRYDIRSGNQILHTFVVDATRPLLHRVFTFIVLLVGLVLIGKYIVRKKRK